MKTKIISFTLLLFLTTIPTKAQQWEFVGLDSLVILHLKVEQDTIYAGTLSRNNNLNAGLYVSSSQGNIWSQIDSSLGSGSIWTLERNFDNSIYIIKCPCQAPLADSLYKSTNNGKFWGVVTNISVNPIQWFGISPFNPNEMYAIDVLALGGGRYFNTLFKSTNRGDSWESIGSFPGSSHGSELRFAFDFTDSTNLYVAVDARLNGLYFFKSTDEGENWFYVSTTAFFPTEIYTDYFIPDRIYLTPYPYISNDGGSSWSKADSGLTDTSYYISFYQDNARSILYLLRSDGLYFSRNDTIFWNKIEGSENLPLFMGPNGFPFEHRNLRNIFIDNLTKKIFVGTASGIYRTDIVISIKNEEISIPNETFLDQNYPNPFNSSTIIEYSVNATTFVSIKVYDMLGREVATLVNEEKSVGSYKVSFNAGELASGIYFYTIQSGNFSSSQKMILLK